MPGRRAGALVACRLSCRLSARRSESVSQPPTMHFRLVARQATRQARQRPALRRGVRREKSKKERPTAAWPLTARCARAASPIGAKVADAPLGAWTSLRGGKSPRIVNGGPWPHRGAVGRQFPSSHARVRVEGPARKPWQLGNPQVSAGCRGSTSPIDATGGINRLKSGGMATGVRPHAQARGARPRPTVLLLPVKNRPALTPPDSHGALTPKPLGKRGVTRS